MGNDLKCACGFSMGKNNTLYLLEGAVGVGCVNFLENWCFETSGVIKLRDRDHD